MLTVHSYGQFDEIYPSPNPLPININGSSPKQYIPANPGDLDLDGDVDFDDFFIFAANFGKKGPRPTGGAGTGVQTVTVHDTVYVNIPSGPSSSVSGNVFRKTLSGYTVTIPSGWSVYADTASTVSGLRNITTLFSNSVTDGAISVTAIVLGIGQTLPTTLTDADISSFESYWVASGVSQYQRVSIVSGRLGAFPTRELTWTGKIQSNSVQGQYIFFIYDRYEFIVGLTSPISTYTKDLVGFNLFKNSWGVSSPKIAIEQPLLSQDSSQSETFAQIWSVLSELLGANKSSWSSP